MGVYLSVSFLGDYFMVQKQNTLFTDAYIEKLQPQQAKMYRVWDAKISGFGCRVFPTGRKVYMYQYRTLEGKKNAVTIGKHGLINASLARKKASDLVAQIFRGVNPQTQKKEEKQQSKSGMLFKDFWDIFDKKYMQVTHKPSTINRNKSRIKNNILPFFGEKILSEITKREIIAFSEKLSHIKGTLSKSLRLLSCAFNKAIAWEYLPEGSNPCNGVSKPADKKMERFLTNEELLRVEDVLLNADKQKACSPYGIAALTLLLYTGCRKSEILTLKWEDVHLQEKYLYFVDSNTGTKTVPLNEKAIQLLEKMPKQTGNPYVFCGKHAKTHIINITKTWQFVRQAALISDVRIHDLRHSFASFALKKGLDLYTVSKLLGHKNIATTTRYAHFELEQLKKASNKVAEVFS